MASRDFRVELVGLVDDFMRRVVLVAKRAAFEELAKAMDAATADRMRRRLFGDAAPLASSPRPPAPAAVAAVPARKGAKRPPAAIADTTARLRTFIAEHPGLRVEQINRALGTRTRDLALPLRNLVAAGVVRTEGQKRSDDVPPGGRVTRGGDAGDVNRTGRAASASARVAHADGQAQPRHGRRSATSNNAAMAAWKAPWSRRASGPVGRCGPRSAARRGLMVWFQKSRAQNRSASPSTGEVHSHHSSQSWGSRSASIAKRRSCAAASSPRVSRFMAKTVKPRGDSRKGRACPRFP